MVSFRYQAREPSGSLVEGEVDAIDRQRALSLLADRGLFPSRLDVCSEAAAETGVAVERRSGSAQRAPREDEAVDTAPVEAPKARERGPDVDVVEHAREAQRPPRKQVDLPAAVSPVGARRPQGRVTRKEVTAFTREMATLLEASIPIPRALEGLGDEEENDALRGVIEDLGAQVRGGRSLSQALATYPTLFPPLYSSMVKVGEESGQLARVLDDLATLLENEDEIRGEVLGAVAYPVFVLIMGAVTTFVLLAFVLPRLFGMLEDLMDALPMPTRILLATSRFFQGWWLVLVIAIVAAALLLRWYYRSPAGGARLDRWKLRVPVVGPVFRASVLTRFARTLGTLVHSGVSLLPALEIVRNTVGNRHVSRQIDEVAEGTRGGDSLATPIRRLGLFPATMVQMIAVGEETGTLDVMLLKVAKIQERHMRGRSKTLISLLAPVLILVVGALVGFIVVALLLPIFRMSSSLR